MAHLAKYEAQEHDGLKWYTVTTNRDLSRINTEYTALKVIRPDRAHRVILGTQVVCLHDPRAEVTK